MVIIFKGTCLPLVGFEVWPPPFALAAKALGPSTPQPFCSGPAAPSKTGARLGPAVWSVRQAPKLGPRWTHKTWKSWWPMRQELLRSAWPSSTSSVQQCPSKVLRSRWLRSFWAEGGLFRIDRVLKGEKT